MVAEIKNTSAARRNVLIDEVISFKRSRQEPCLAIFPNGAASSSSGYTGHLYGSSADGEVAKRKRVLEVIANNQKYIGKNYNNNGDVQTHDSLYLGVLDKQTGKMKLIETSTFQLQNTCEKITQESDDDDVELTYFEKQERFAEFGGRRAKVAIRKKKIEMGHPESMVEAIQSGMQEIDTTNVHTDETDDSWRELIPHRNDKAQHPEGVYKLDNLISDDDLVQLYDHGEAVLTEDLSDDKFANRSELFKTTIAMIKSNAATSEDTKVKYACAAYFMDFLVAFSRLGAFESKLQYPITGCPQPLQDKIRSQFSTRQFGKCKRSTEQMHKIACHVIIMALILNRFSLSLPVVLQSIPVKEDILTNLCKVIGTVKARGSITLKTPLTTPSLIAKQRKKKSRF